MTFLLSFRGKKLSRAKLRIHHLLLKGYGKLDNLTVASSNHMEMFYSSADWLVRHQDSSGGWPIVIRVYNQLIHIFVLNDYIISRESKERLQLAERISIPAGIRPWVKGKQCLF